MKKYFLMLALMATVVFGVSTVRAVDTNAAPAATLDQRVASLEAYISNGDPTAGLKGTNGNINVTSPILNTTMTNSVGAVVNYPGAGHNAWLLTSTALVLFMTLPGLGLF